MVARGNGECLDIMFKGDSTTWGNISELTV